MEAAKETEVGPSRPDDVTVNKVKKALDEVRKEGLIEKVKNKYLAH